MPVSFDRKDIEIQLKKTQLSWSWVGDGEFTADVRAGLEHICAHVRGVNPVVINGKEEWPDFLAWAGNEEPRRFVALEADPARAVQASLAKLFGCLADSLDKLSKAMSATGAAQSVRGT